MGEHYYVSPICLPNTIRSQVEEYIKKVDGGYLDSAYRFKESSCPNHKKDSFALQQEDEGCRQDPVDKLIAQIALWIQGSPWDGQYVKWDYGGVDQGFLVIANGEVICLDLDTLVWARILDESKPFSKLRVKLDGEIIQLAHDKATILIRLFHEQTLF